MATKKTTKKTLSIAETVDELGEVKSVIKAYTKTAEGLITAVKAKGVGSYEGGKYTAAITERVSSSTDWEKVALEAGLSKYIIAEHTRTVTVMPSVVSAP